MPLIQIKDLFGLDLNMAGGLLDGVFIIHPLLGSESSEVVVSSKNNIFCLTAITFV